MKTKYWLFIVLAILFGVAMIGIFSEPSDELSNGAWWTALVGSKVIGIAAGACVVWIVRSNKELRAFCDEMD